MPRSCPWVIVTDMFRAAFFFLAATLIFAPLAFGAAEPWSMMVVQLLTGCGCLCLAWSWGRGDGRSLYRVPGVLPLILLLLWIFLQCVPLPVTFVRTFAPSVYEVYRPVLEISGHDLLMPLTVNQRATLFEGMRIATYVLLYILTVQILSSGRYLRKTVWIVAWLAIGIAFLAIIQKFTSPDRIYWFRATPPNAGTVGPWVYHNHYAGFMEMVLPLVLALFFFYRPTVDPDRPLRNRVAALFSSSGSDLHFLLGFGAIVIVASVFVSLSRGGIISLGLASVFFLVVVPRRVLRTRLPTYAFLLTGAVLLVTWFGWGNVAAKFGAVLSRTGGIEDVRLVVWRDSVRIISDFLLTGTGFATFFHVYPLYTTLTTGFVIDHAHNDYLELLTDGGLIGFSLAAWFVLAVLREGWSKIGIRRDRYAVFLSVGAMTGIIAILLHGVTDFNMRNGANGLYFFFLCGLLVSAGNTRLYYRTRPTLLAGAGAGSGKVLLAAGFLLAATALLVRGGGIVAGVGYAGIADTYLSGKLNREKLERVAATARRAGRYDPLEGKYSFALGSALIFLKQPEGAMTSFMQAARKDPLSGVFLQRLALVLASTDRAAAEELMHTAYARALNKEYLVLTWADWLLSMNERDKAVTMLGKVFADNPLLTEKFLPILSRYSFDREEVTAMLPDSVSSWYHYGALLEKRGDLEGAEFYRTRALDFLDAEEMIQPWFFSQLYRFYLRRSEEDKAVAVLRRAIEVLPDEPSFHVYLGDYYRAAGIRYRAREEYEQALLLEPADDRVRRKLEKLTGKR